ncbi:unnamed protein product [Alternaria alternata]|uniref:Cupin 2 conserved barrel domain-containing protein n=2 Tax=Alternaria alternata complex TaxID=187734 RepID=A0A4Q4NHT4_ALTAL|nr:hypothetical protein AA0117_g5452 [Alternaria alternata]RYN98696.1 hypothetical protein AA0119_g6884 [Alternaria tenuissima]RYO18402.1 hypothetical protein AA0121_g5069 [Alternaria tenuissima]
MAENDARLASSEMYESITSLPPAKRYIVTHNEQGKSTIHSSPALQFYGYPGVGGTARSYATSSTPATLEGDKDIEAYTSKEGDVSYTGRSIVSNGSGSHLIVCELGPGQASQMHQTVSIDYVVCTHGKVKLETATGEMVNLNPGDHIIQRGTMHKWHNPSETEPCRFIAFVQPAEPFQIPSTGKMLAEEHVSGSEAKDFDLSKL